MSTEPTMTLRACDASCWTPVPCPHCRRDLYPKGRSVGLETYEPYCCQDAKYETLNTRHLWDEHDGERWRFDPAGETEHSKTCAACAPEPDLVGPAQLDEERT